MGDVAKQAQDLQCFLRPAVPTANARTAIKLFLTSVGQELGHPPKVLIPAYYGWSPREGSGVLDPIREAGAFPVLCRVDRNLQVDGDRYQDLLDHDRPDVVMLIHYFGWPDANVASLAAAARASGAVLLEDEAHSLLTDLVGGMSGRHGQAAAASVHKCLPLHGGGVMFLNQPSTEAPGDTEAPFWQYDLWSIGQRRLVNTQIWTDLLREAKTPGALLHERVPEGVIPLNLPFLVAPERRQLVYEVMNDAGFGVVCLYHRLGDGITEDEHPDSFWLSERTVNLPVHQDLQPAHIPEMHALLHEVLTS